MIPTERVVSAASEESIKLAAKVIKERGPRRIPN